MEPRFPLDPRNPPTCRECGSLCIRKIVGLRNPIGNPGRPYYTCDNEHENLFSTWGDYEGIADGNPRCRCGFTSRRGTNRSGVDFYSCPNRFNGGCGWTKTCSDQLGLVPRTSTLPAVGAVLQRGPQPGSQYRPQYASQNPSYGPQQFPPRFPQYVPVHVRQNIPQRFPQDVHQDVPQYGYPQSGAYEEVPVRERCCSCCLVM